MAMLRTPRHNRYIRNEAPNVPSNVFAKEIDMTDKSPKAANRKANESKDRGIIKPLMETGLPPGISKQQAADPGNMTKKKRPVKNES
jgi:hypothetical protein